MFLFKKICVWFFISFLITACIVAICYGEKEKVDKNEMIRQINNDELVFSNDEFVDNIITWQSKDWIVRDNVIVYRGFGHQRVMIFSSGEIIIIGQTDYLNVSSSKKEELKDFYTGMIKYLKIPAKPPVEYKIPDCSH